MSPLRFSLFGFGRLKRHNTLYTEALALHGEGSPHSEPWARAKQLYDAVISDE